MAALLLCTYLSGYRDRARAYSAALCAKSFVTEPGAAARDCRRIQACFRLAIAWDGAPRGASTWRPYLHRRKPGCTGLVHCRGKW
jgi:hypothetical protein